MMELTELRSVETLLKKVVRKGEMETAWRMTRHDGFMLFERLRPVTKEYEAILFKGTHTSVSSMCGPDKDCRAVLLDIQVACTKRESQRFEAEMDGARS